MRVRSSLPLVLVLATPAATAQSLPTTPWAPTFEVGDRAGAAAWSQEEGEPQMTWVNSLASLLVPGTGQLAAGQDRGIVYLGIEVYLLVRGVSAWDDGQSSLQGDG